MTPITAVASAAPTDAMTLDVAHYLRPGTITLPVLPPLSLYVHVPWCLRKCPYCDFNSHEQQQPIDEVAYLAALRSDLEVSLPLVWGRPIISVFIGGGTPSLLSADGVERLLSDLRALLPLEPDCEITLEANPGTFEAQRFAAYRRSGINRLSIGVQSFDPAKLAVLGRVHDDHQARAAIEIAAAHFDNFNLDLMYALPGQTVEQAQADIACALSYSPPHLSAYQLTLEPNTIFAKHPPQLPDEDIAADIHHAVEAMLRDRGYLHYEVSAYAMPGRKCRHNLNYWMFGDYLGIGAGAASKLSFPHRIIRQQRFKQPASYMAAAMRRQPIAASNEVKRAELPFEFMLNTLRLEDGVAADLWQKRTGLPFSAIERPLAEAQRRGLLDCDHERWRPTPLGYRFLTDLQSLFLPSTTCTTAVP